MVQIIRITEAARQKGCSRQTIYTALKNGRLRSITLDDGSILLKKDKLWQQWMPGDGTGISLTGKRRTKKEMENERQKQ